MKQIIVLSAVPWFPRPVRAQHICSRLTTHRILFVNPPPGLDWGREPLDGKTGGADWKDEGEPVSKWLTVLTPPPVLPMSGELRIAAKLAARKIGRFVRERMADYGFEKPVLWCCTPFNACCLPHIPHQAVVYDASYDTFWQSGRVSSSLTGSLEAELCGAADIVLAPSGEKLREIEPLCKKTALLPNGANFELFNRAAGELPFPADMFSVKNPIFGHVGVVDKTTDMTFIEDAARAHPEWTFIFIGPVLPDADLSPVTGLRNVRMMGLKPHKQLPAYMSRFDVCVNIARGSDSAGSPLKLYEYLATGKPIVSTPHPSQVMDYVDVLTVAGSPADFTEACRKALLERDAWRVRQRIAYGQASSWEARAAELERTMKEAGVF